MQCRTRNTGGAQYAELQNMLTRVLQARVTVAVKLAEQAMQSEMNYAAKRDQEVRQRAQRAATAAVNTPVPDSENAESREEDDGGGGNGDSGGGQHHGRGGGGQHHSGGGGGQQGDGGCGGHGGGGGRCGSSRGGGSGGGGGGQQP